MGPYRSTDRTAKGPRPPREERRSSFGILFLALVPLVGFAIGGRFSDRELMVGVLLFILALSVLVRRSPRAR